MKKCICFVLAFVMVLSLAQVSLAKEVVPSAQTAVRVSKANQVTTVVSAAGVEAIEVEKTPVALKFKAENPLVKIGTHGASWGNSTGTFKVEIYQWNDNYTSTTKVKPLCSFITPDVPDGKEFMMDIPGDVEMKGELLVVFCSDGDTDDLAGIWRAPVGNAKMSVQGFTNGEPVNDFILPLKIETKEITNYPALVDEPKKDAYSTIYGADYAGSTADDKTGYISLGNGKSVVYAQVDFGETSPKGVVAKVGTTSGNMGEIQMYLDNPETGKCIAAFRFNNTALYGESSVKESTAQITEKITGVHDLYVCSNEATSYDLREFRFTKEAVALSEWEQRIADFEPVAESDIIENYSSTWTATDMLGRKLPDHSTVGDPKADRAVGMFYWSWHSKGRADSTSTANNQLIMDSYPGDTDEIINDYSYYKWRDTGYWNESVYGYYITSDEWVMRKQFELLGAAGVDAIFCDNSNGFNSFSGAYLNIAKVMHEMRKDGIKVPKLSFILPFVDKTAARQQLENIYQNFYQSGLYSDTWYYWNGKPLIIAMETSLNGVATNDEQAELHSEMKNFFTFRSCEPDYLLGEGERDAHIGTTQWSWLQCSPQHTFGKTADGRVEQIAVGTAMNHTGTSISAMNGKGVMGRSYTYKDKFAKLSDISKFYGYNFAEQWERALTVDPAMVFVTGWNEWTAGNNEKHFGINNAYVDTFDDEHSRDLEPTKGDFKDCYYYQLVSYIRKYKGVLPLPEASEAKTINLSVDFAQWNDVKPEFMGYRGGTEPRDSYAAKVNGRNHYTNTTGRNDIILSKVARDDANVYFYVETAEDITPYTDAKWMRLLIDTDRSYETGWEGYDYIINRVNPTADTVTVEKASKDWTFETAGQGSYTVDGNKMMISIPRSVLGLEGKTLDIEFKWADNNLVSADDLMKGDIMSFYTDGDTAPIGRYNYHYAQDTSKTKKIVDEPQIPMLTGHDYIRRASAVMAIDNPVAMLEGDAVLVDENNENVYPIIVNNKTLIPVRFLAESTGALVRWMEESSTANIMLGTKTIRITEGSKTMIVGKERVELEVPAQTINDRMYVPLRDIVEALEMQCAWLDPGVILFGTNVLSFNLMPDVIDYLERFYGMEINN